MKRKIKRAEKFWVYIVECADGTYYTGYTKDLEKRLRWHNDGLASKYTRARLPVKLAWKKACKNQAFAMKAESIIKKLKREDKERIVQGQRLDNVLRSYKSFKKT